MVSIVTINRNNAAGLERTIRSVIGQSYKDIEYIIIDGASSDCSTSIIERYKDHVHYWISEGDNGIYDAMNKGLNKSSGAYVLFLNSGDYLNNETVLEQMISCVDTQDIVYGNIGFLKEGRLRVVPSTSKVTYQVKYQHDLPPQPAMLMRREVLIALGGFDTSYKIVADVVLIAKAFCKPGITYKHVDLLTTIFDKSGISSKAENQNEIYAERKRFILEHFPQYLKDLEQIYHPSLWTRVKSKVKNLIT